jgi:hypothetical protein
LNNTGDSDSIVAESYISDYHVHQQKRLDGNVSGFELKVAELADQITKLGTVRKLVQISNGLWVTPLDCAQGAVNEAGSMEFPFNVRYRELATANQNDIEFVADQHIPRLEWQPNSEARYPGSIFLFSICRKVFDQVFFFKCLI